MQIFPGDVLFVWGNGPIDHIIEGVTDGPSHVALFVNPNTVEESQGGRLAGEQDLSFYLQGNACLEVWEDPTLTDEERAEMVSFAHTLYGKRYDYVLIPLELLHFECGLPLGWYHNDDTLICSGDVYAVGQHVKRVWSKVPNPAPVDLIRGGTLQKKGNLLNQQVY